MMIKKNGCIKCINGKKNISAIWIMNRLRKENVAVKRTILIFCLLSDIIQSERQFVDYIPR